MPSPGHLGAHRGPDSGSPHTHQVPPPRGWDVPPASFPALHGLTTRSVVLGGSQTTKLPLGTQHRGQGALRQAKSPQQLLSHGVQAPYCSGGVGKSQQWRILSHQDFFLGAWRQSWIKRRKAEALPTWFYLIWHQNLLLPPFPCLEEDFFFKCTQLQITPSSLSVKLNQDKRSPVPHFLQPSAGPCGPFPNLPSLGTAPSPHPGDTFSPSSPSPPHAVLRALSPSRKPRTFCTRGLAVRLLNLIPSRHQGKLELPSAPSWLRVGAGCSCGCSVATAESEGRKWVRNSFLHQRVINAWNSSP